MRSWRAAGALTTKPGGALTRRAGLRPRATREVTIRRCVVGAVRPREPRIRPLTLHGAHADDHLVQAVVRVELLGLQVGRREAVQKPRCRQHVPVRARRRRSRRRTPPRRAAGGASRVVPPLAVLLVLRRRDPRDPGDRREEHAAGREDPVQRRERGANVVDELERLRDDRAVERVARDLRGVGEVADDRRFRVAFRRHEDVALLDPVTEPVRVVGRGDLEDACRGCPPHAPPRKRVHVDAVDRRAPLEAPVRVDRRRTPECAEVDGPAPPPVDVGGAERTQAVSRRSGHESSPALQGRDHSAPWSRPTPASASSSSRRTWTTACSPSARRWRRGPGAARGSSSSPSSRATPARGSRGRVGRARRLRHGRRGVAWAAGRGQSCVRAVRRDARPARLRVPGLRAARDR